jgi:hypothetical protein
VHMIPFCLNFAYMLFLMGEVFFGISNYQLFTEMIADIQCLTCRCPFFQVDYPGWCNFPYKFLEVFYTGGNSGRFHKSLSIINHGKIQI